jgi:XTP/dITP diphosphohydrolase
MPLHARHIVLATANPHKVTEMSEILGDLDIRVSTLAAFAPMQDVDETGSTLAENALLKAVAVQQHTGQAALADDTGLEVDALDGRPGVYSARYAGVSASYADNVEKLLRELEQVPMHLRTARFRTVIALLDRPSDPVFFEGVVEGHIGIHPTGTFGFGYDPVFIPSDGDGRTFAQFEAHEKNAISHRGRALQKFIDWLHQNKQR